MPIVFDLFLSHIIWLWSDNCNWYNFFFFKGKEELKLKAAFKQNPLSLQSPSPSPSFSESPQPTEINCDRSHKSYDLCTINGPTVLDPTIATFYTLGHQDHVPPSYKVEKMKPYPRKWESSTMKRIREITLTSGLPGPSCQVQHNAPALVFSAGGYTGNFFHDFNDGIIPLFITVHSIFTDDQEFVLVISKARDWWVNKYADLLQSFSKHPIVNLDNDSSTHCFTSATIGLISHGLMAIDPKLLPNSQTFFHFRAFLDRAYGRHHGENHPIKSNSSKQRPRLLLISRNGDVGRVILNQIQVKKLAEKIGFDVTIFEPTTETSLWKAYTLINSTHAMVGVHGAALTHSLFLRPGSVFMQVVPLGNEWVAKYCFGNSGRTMGLEYMQYKIGVEESTLVDKYDRNSLLLKDPVAFQGKNWSHDIMNIYLKEQNVKLDLVRFRQYLKYAYRKAKRFMSKKR